MVFAASLGLGSAAMECVTGLVLGLNGNAITLAQSFWEAGVRDGHSLARLVRQYRKRLVLGIPFLYSSHHFLLRAWLRSHGLVPGPNVLLVVVPPPQMPSNLKAGHLDGYCVGEPWNTVASLGGFGWRAATSVDIAPNHPEKVLMVRREFSESRPEEHEGLIAAVAEAGRFCATPEHRERIIDTLAERRYLNLSTTIVRSGFDGGARLSVAPDVSMESAHEPSADKAEWILQHLDESGLLPNEGQLRKGLAAEIFRPDIFQKATQQHRRYETNRIVSLSN
jgi:ABC-type nitrate/sulfonate/bicarbonate transport system substrate-binding protein